MADKRIIVRYSLRAETQTQGSEDALVFSKIYCVTNHYNL